MKTREQIKNEIVYIRQLHDPLHPFRIISMSLLNDDRLNYIEIGLMVKVLSNADNFSFVASYNQRKSGIGQDMFYKASKHLQELGYLIKTPIAGGGWNWIVVESKEQIEKLKELEWITYNSTKKNWKVVNRNLFSHQVPDFTRISDFPNTEIPNTDSAAADFPNTDIRSRDMTGKTITKEINTDRINKQELNNPPIEKSNNETNRDSQALAEAGYKYEEKIENETSIKSIPDGITLPAKQPIPVGISSISDTSVLKPSVVNTSDLFSVVGTTLPAKQNISIGTSTIKNTSGLKASVENSLDWTSIVETNSPAKHHIPAKKPAKQSTPMDKSMKDKHVYGNSFEHQGIIFKPAERLDLINNQYYFKVSDNFRSDFLEPEGIQIVLGLYNQFLNQDIIKHNRVSFNSFEQMILISNINRMGKVNEKVPSNRDELQSCVTAFNLVQFEETFNYLTNNEEELRKHIPKLIGRYSNFR